MWIKGYEPPSTEVRVRKDVEELVRILAKRYGIEIYKIRNLAILIGLAELNRYLYENGPNDIDRIYAEIKINVEKMILGKPLEIVDLSRILGKPDRRSIK